MRPKIDEICRIYSLKEPEAEEVLRMYDSANGNLNAFCLMGRRVIIDKIVGIRIDSDALMRTEKVANFFYTDVDQNGNVLAAKSWNIAKNDAWVLGGINANCTFNIVYDKKIENYTDIDAFIDECIDSHSEEYPLTVTAREIFGLREAGYTPIIMYGALFFVPNSNVHTMSLAQYHSAINYAHFNSNDGQDKDYTKNLIKKYLLSSLNGQ